MRTGNIRWVLGAALLVMVCLLGGCRANTSIQKENELVVFNYGDYIDRDTLKMFEKETGIKVKYEEYVTPEDMYTKYNSGVIDYDVICTSDYMIQKLAMEKELIPLDWSSMENRDNLDPRYLEICSGFDPDNRYACPYLFGTVGILYNQKEVKEEVDSWSILWNPTYKDEIIMQDSMRDAFMVPLKWKGYSLNTKSKKELKEAQRLLIDQKPLVEAYLVDESRDALIAGDASMAVIYSGDAEVAIEANEDLSYAVPREGTNIWFDCWFVPKSCKHKEEAMKFIDFMNREDVAALNFDYILYGTPNKAVYESLDEETREDSTIFPDEATLGKCEIYNWLGEDMETYYSRLWKELKAK